MHPKYTKLGDLKSWFMIFCLTRRMSPGIPPQNLKVPIIVKRPPAATEQANTSKRTAKVT